MLTSYRRMARQASAWTRDPENNLTNHSDDAENTALLWIWKNLGRSREADNPDAWLAAGARMAVRQRIHRVLGRDRRTSLPMEVVDLEQIPDRPRQGPRCESLSTLEFLGHHFGSRCVAAILGRMEGYTFGEIGGRRGCGATAEFKHLRQAASKILERWPNFVSLVLQGEL